MLFVTLLNFSKPLENHISSTDPVQQLAASMIRTARLVLCVSISVILCNVGCENREDQKLAEDDNVNNALVAVGTEDDEDASVEGM